MQSIRAKLAQHLEDAWYGRTGLTLVLRPVSWLFITIATLRRLGYQFKVLKNTKLAVPVIIVGNLTVTANFVFLRTLN